MLFSAIFHTSFPVSRVIYCLHVKLKLLLFDKRQDQAGRVNFFFCTSLIRKIFFSPLPLLFPAEFMIFQNVSWQVLVSGVKKVFLIIELSFICLFAFSFRGGNFQCNFWKVTDKCRRHFMDTYELCQIFSFFPPHHFVNGIDFLMELVL